MKAFLSKRFVWNTLVGIAFVTCLTAFSSLNGSAPFSPTKELLTKSPAFELRSLPKEKSCSAALSLDSLSPSCHPVGRELGNP